MNWSDQVEDRRRETQKDKKSDIKQNDKRTPPPFDLFLIFFDDFEKNIEVFWKNWYIFFLFLNSFKYFF